MNHHLRRAVGLVGVAALVSGAMAAGTGAALAGKATPTAVLNSGDCQVDVLQVDVLETRFWRTRYDATLDLSHNKGRWLFVQASVEFDAGGDLETNIPQRTKVDKGAWLTVEAADYDVGAQGADLVLTFTDRRGATVNTQRFEICSTG